MTFGEKSAWATVAAVAVAYGWYLATVLGQLDGGPVGAIDYQGTAVFAAIAVVVILSVTHIVLAARGRHGATANSATDAIKRYARSVGGVVVTAAAVLAMALAMVESETFWIANVLLAGLVAAELASAGSEIVTYRRRA